MSTRKRREAREKGLHRVGFLDGLYPIDTIVKVRDVQTGETSVLDVTHAILKDRPFSSVGWGEPWMKI